MQIDSERLEDKVQRVIDDYLFGEDHKPLIKELYAREIKHTAIVKELREALEECVRWYGLRHDIPGTPLKDTLEQKEPIRKAQEALLRVSL